MAQAEGRAAAQRSTATSYSIQNAFADVDNALVANQKLQDQLAAQERLVAALQDYARLAKLQYDGGYTSLHDRAAGGAVAVPGRAHARVGARVGVRVDGEHLQGDGRRLGHDADRATTGGQAAPVAEKLDARQPLF